MSSQQAKKVIVVMPAYNAEATLRKTYEEVIASGCVDEIILVDDSSSDKTYEIAKTLPHTTVVRHDRNLGYGGNQKTCYTTALEHGADFIVMVHPDYQYTPKLIPSMVALLDSGLYDCVLASRILGGYAIKNGMPAWRYAANRLLTLAQNLFLSAKLSEYHTGYRAFSRQLLETLPFDQNSDDFVFDNQMLVQILWYGHTIAEVSCPTAYAAESSSISFSRCVRYGFGCLRTTLEFLLSRVGLLRSKRFPPLEQKCGV